MLETFTGLFVKKKLTSLHTIIFLWFSSQLHRKGKNMIYKLTEVLYNFNLKVQSSLPMTWQHQNSKTPQSFVLPLKKFTGIRLHCPLFTLQVIIIHSRAPKQFKTSNVLILQTLNFCVTR